MLAHPAALRGRRRNSMRTLAKSLCRHLHIILVGPPSPLQGRLHQVTAGGVSKPHNGAARPIHTCTTHLMRRGRIGLHGLLVSLAESGADERQWRRTDVGLASPNRWSSVRIRQRSRRGDFHKLGGCASRRSRALRARSAVHGMSFSCLRSTRGHHQGHVDDAQNDSFSSSRARNQEVATDTVY